MSLGCSDCLYVHINDRYSVTLLTRHSRLYRMPQKRMHSEDSRPGTTIYARRARSRSRTPPPAAKKPALQSTAGSASSSATLPMTSQQPSASASTSARRPQPLSTITVVSRANRAQPYVPVRMTAGNQPRPRLSTPTSTTTSSSSTLRPALRVTVPNTQSRTAVTALHREPVSEPAQYSDALKMILTKINKNDYGKVAYRGYNAMPQRGGVKRALPNVHGILPDGRTYESPCPTAAPVAKWWVQRNDNSLQFTQAYREGVMPISSQMYRANGQYYVTTNFATVPPEILAKEEDGPMLLHAVTNPTLCQSTYSKVIEQPLEIPQQQARFDCNSQNDALLGIGYCNEDNATARFWFRKIMKERGVQTLDGPDPLAGPDIICLKPAEVETKWEDEVYLLPQNWFQLPHEHLVLDTLVKAIERSENSLKTQLAVAMRTMHHHIAFMNETMPFRMDHDSAVLKRRCRRFATAWPAMSEDIHRFRIERILHLMEVRSSTQNALETAQQHRYMIAAEIEFYYRHVKEFEYFSAILPATSALVYGIPYYIKLPNGEVKYKL